MSSQRKKKAPAKKIKQEKPTPLVKRTGPLQISDIPNELLREIFLQEAIAPSLLKLTGVCRNWRELITGTPELWSKITVKAELSQSTLEASVKKVDMYLARSGNRPLEVVLNLQGTDSSTHYVNSIIEPLIQNQHRWRVAKFHLDGLNIAILSQLSATCLTQLEHVTFDVPRTTGNVALADIWQEALSSPIICSAEVGSGGPLTLLYEADSEAEKQAKASNMAKLKNLSVWSASLDDLLDCLKLTTKLVSLTISLVFFVRATPMTQMVALPVLKSLEITTKLRFYGLLVQITTPVLESLSITYTVSPCSREESIAVRDFLKREGSTLRVLNLSFTRFGDKEFLQNSICSPECLQELVSLQELSLRSGDAAPFDELTLNRFLKSNRIFPQLTSLTLTPCASAVEHLARVIKSREGTLKYVEAHFIDEGDHFNDKNAAYHIRHKITWATQSKLRPFLYPVE